MTVVDGRAEICDEADRTGDEIRTYLRDRIGALLDAAPFMAALPGHLPGDDASQARAPIVIERPRRLAGRR